MLRRLALVLPLVILAAACRSGRREPELPSTVPVGEPLELRAPWTPPADWASMPPYEFAALMEAELPEAAMTPIAPEAHDELRAALDAMDATSVRAAVILGRSRTDDSGNILARRLARRQVGSERHSDAGDVVAAAALARIPEPERYWRLIFLVDGEAPHPDFEVRVEVACTAVRIGFDRAIPFLLQVLRIGTWRGQAEDQLDFTPPQTTAWARGRAATTLSIRAGVPRTYQPDGPIADREREAARLEELLAEVIANASVVEPRLLGR